MARLDPLWHVGLTPWPRLFQALRQSCETDFAKRCPQHAVSRWMGQDVSERHDLQVTPDIYQIVTDANDEGEHAAAGSRTKAQGDAKQNDATCDAKKENLVTASNYGK